VLIPLKVGNVLLPNVEIRARPNPKEEDKRKSGGGKGGGESEGELNCETDYWSYGECVVVIPDVRSSTVGIGEMGSRGVWLESTAR
jgi:hypothetical protein